MKSTIGERMREARENREFDQSTLAEKVGIVTRTLQRWALGPYEEKITKFFGYDKVLPMNV